MVIHSADKSPYAEYDVIATGLKLDAISGIGGIATRRITEVFGPYSVGKTTLAIQLVAEAQKDGMKCLWSDIEFAWDGKYASALGVNLTKVGLIQEQVAEDALDDILAWAGKNKRGFIVLDAVGALHPRVAAEKSSDGKSIGSQAKLVSEFCRRIVPLLAVNNHALLMLNHSFQDIMNHGVERTSGGQKLAYHKSLSIKLKQKFGSSVVRGSDGAKVGIVIEAEIMKNKMAATAGMKCELMMLPGAGFSKEHDLLQDLLASGEVVKKGNTYWRGSVKLGVGLTKAREALKDHAKEES